MWLWLIKRTLNALSAGHRCYRSSKFFFVQSDSCLLSTDWFSKSVVVVVLDVAVVVVVVVVASFTLSLSLSLMHPHTHTLSLSMRITACKIAVIFFSVPTCKKYRSSFFRRQLFENVIAETTRMKVWVSEWVCEFFRSPWYSLSFSLALFLSFSLCSLSLSLSLSFSLSLSLSLAHWIGLFRWLQYCPIVLFPSPVFFGHTNLCKGRSKKGVMK